MTQQQALSSQQVTSGRRVRVELGTRSYEIAISTGGWEHFPTLIRQWQAERPEWRTDTPQALLVTDSQVAPLFAERVLQAFTGADWRIQLLIVPAGESSKSLSQTEAIYSQLVAMQADRKTLVLALGGGVMGDLAGFAAATYARGLPFVQIPTTLLADVDSSVGGKVGINLPAGKNLVGAFHQPLGVLIDTECLQTLPDRDFRSGLAEVVKYGVIQDADFFVALEGQIEAINRRDPALLQEIVARCCRLKAGVVEADEYERTGLRAILNYGHTFAHAYEALSGYGELTHGEAVAIGMHDACLLAEKLGRVGTELRLRQQALLTALHLPTRLPESLRRAPEEYIACMRLDKKSVAGKLRFILPDRLGHVELVANVPEELVREVLLEGLKSNAS